MIALQRSTVRMWAERDFEAAKRMIRYGHENAADQDLEAAAFWRRLAKSRLHMALYWRDR